MLQQMEGPPDQVPTPLFCPAAAMASDLVQRLGIRTNTDAPDIFSGEQEGEAAELPAAE